MQALNKDIYGFQSALSVTLIVFSLFSLLAGCSPIRPAHRPSIEPITSSQELMRRVQMREREVQGVKGIAKVKFSDAKKSYPTVREVIIAERPSSLRMETLGFFNKPFFLLAAKENEMSLLSTKENTFYRGSITSDILSKIFPISLNIKDLFSILMGGTPLIDSTEAAIKFLPKKKVYLAEFTGGEEGLKQYLWVNPWNFTPIRTEIYNSSKKLVLGVKFNAYKKINGHLFPVSTSIQLPTRSTKLKIEYSELAVNGEIDPNAFDLKVPPGAKIIDLDE